MLGMGGDSCQVQDPHVIITSQSEQWVSTCSKATHRTDETRTAGGQRHLCPSVPLAPGTMSGRKVEEWLPDTPVFPLAGLRI